MNETKQNQTAKLNIVHNKKIPKASLIEPNTSGYLLFALEVDHRPPIGFFLESKKKQKILRNLKTLVANLNDKKIIDATIPIIMDKFFKINFISFFIYYTFK